MSAETELKAAAGFRFFGPIYLFVVIVHVWLAFWFINTFLLVNFGLVGLRSAWNASALPQWSVFDCFLVTLSALSVIVVADWRASIRSADSKAFRTIGFSVNGILLAGLWVNAYVLWDGPLDDERFAQLVQNEDIGYRRGYTGFMLDEEATGCRNPNETCLRVELETGTRVVANLVETPGLPASPVVYVDEIVGRFSEESWFEAAYVDSGDPELFWRSIVRRYR